MSRDDAIDYSPLHIDPVVEAQVSRQGLNRLPNWLERRLVRTFPRLVLAPNRCHGHESILKQLNSRATFPHRAWATFPKPLKEVLPVLELIRDDLGWPNHHFVPGDPLRLLLVDDDGMSWPWFFSGVALQFSTEYGADDIQRIYAECWTAGQLVLDILERRRSPH